MKAYLGIGLLVISSAALAHPAFVSPRHTHQVAEVVNVQPRFVTVHEQICEQVTVRRPQHSSTPHAGVILGAIAGAALGHQLGGGSGKVIATASGAVIGAHLGRGPHQTDSYDVQTVCRSVPVSKQRGEVVTFNYKGHRFSQVFE